MGRYNEQDIKVILARAAELQQRSAGTGPDSRGNSELTLEEIEEIAQEVGVSPDFVRQAAMEYEGIPVEEPLFLESDDACLLGYASGEMDKRAWAEMRSIIEYHFDAPGKVVRKKEGIRWKAQPKGIFKFFHTRKSPEVEVAVSGGNTTIRIRQNLKTLQKWMWPGWAAWAGAIFFIAIGAAETSGGEEFLGFLFGSGFLVLVGYLFRKWTRRKKEKAKDQLKELMEQLQRIVSRRFTATASRKSVRDNLMDELEIDSNSEETEQTPRRNRTAD